MIFFDRSIPRSVVRALQAVRSDVLWHDDLLPPAATDETWLRLAGTHGYTVITRDKRVRFRPGEIAEIHDAGVGCFVVAASKNLNRWELLKLLVASLDEIELQAARTTRPFIFTVNARGQLARRV